MRLNYISVLVVLMALNAKGQNEQPIVLSPEAFIAQVKQFHPLAKQANLQVEKANAELLAAKGVFDPTVSLEATKKTFNGKNYYYYTNPELKIPIPIGVDVKTGLENNGGEELNPEISKKQSSYLGIEVPLGKGLLIDKRRAALQQAKLFTKQSEQEKRNALNDLLLNAYTAYWQWAGAYQLFNVFDKYVSLASNRLRLMRIAYNNGDRAQTDTIEAAAQLLNYQLMQADALLKLNNTRFELSNYLWTKNDSGYVLSEQYLPDTIQFYRLSAPPIIETLLAAAAIENPIVKATNLKLDALGVEKRLKFQSFLPYVTMKANLLNKEYSVLKNTNWQNNYKYGFDIKIPLLFREARGEYKKVQLKIQETNLYLSAKQWEISNKIRSYHNETNQLLQQINLAKSAVNNYSLLFKAENLKFSNGESSLFLLNSRETKLIESQQKAIELTTKYFKAKYTTDWAVGVLR